MTPREKELKAKIESLEGETRRLFRFERVLLQIWHVVAASRPIMASRFGTLWRTSSASSKRLGFPYRRINGATQ
jgi:hypothetical protein